MKKTNKKGFTIVELVIVIAVIAILAAVMIPTFGGIIDRANQSAAKQEASIAYKAAYAIDVVDGKVDGKQGVTPITEADLDEDIQVEGVTARYTEEGEGTDKVLTFTFTNAKYTVTTTDGVNWTVDDKTAE